MINTPGDDPLPALPASRDLDDETVASLVDGAQRIRVAAGDRVFSENDESDGLFFVVSGRLETVDDIPGPLIGEGDIFGVLEVLSGERRTSSIAASTDAELLKVSPEALDRVLEESEERTEQIVEVAERHLMRREVARLLPDVFEVLDNDTLVELGRVFRWVRLGRGETLFFEGDTGDAVYVLVSGRLRVLVRGEGGAQRVVGEVVPGETVGEMAMVSDEPRSATVVALRASVLTVCERADFDALVDRFPLLSKYVSAILVQRLNKANQRVSSPPKRMSVAVLPLHEGIDLSDFCRSFAAEAARLGSVLHLDRTRVEDRVGGLVSNPRTRLQDLRLLPWFEEQESRHDFVVYEAEPELTSWTTRCVSQADRIVLVADADHDPSPSGLEMRVEEVLEGARPPLHLVLLHPPDRDRPSGTSAWLAARDVRPHHARRGNVRDVRRAVRLIAGRGLGLVLSGGGARGFAHIAVLRALDDLGIEIDAICGASAGGGIASQYAMGLTADEIRDVSKREFVVGRPMKRFTLPVYSLSGRRAIDEACKAVSGGLDIADLWIPFFCTSCDLHSGRKVLHEQGPLWMAIRATMSLPGIVPPVVDGSRLLVDGGVLDNIPEEEMLAFCGGEVIVVDVSPADPIPIDYEYDDLPSPWRILWNRINPFGHQPRYPNVLDVLLRTATIANAGQRGVLDDGSDLVLRPPVHGFGMLDFGAIDQIIAAADVYSRERLSEWLESRDETPT